MKHVTGLDNVLRNLTNEIVKIKNRSRAGLTEAGWIVMNRSQELCPRDEGHLMGDKSVRTYVRQGEPWVRLAYNADYAVYVHEIKFTNYTKPGSQWKFLETALKEKEREVLEAIRRRAYIP